MIKQLLSIALLAGTFSVSAQQNLGFEAWTSGAPDSWQAPLSAFVAGSVTQITTGAPEGSSAIQLTTGSCPFCPLAGLPDRMPGFIAQAEAITTRPTSITFMLQADVMANDEALVVAQVTSWDGVSTAVLGQAGGTIPGGTVINTWTAQTSTFTYNSNPAAADSITIQAASSDSILLTGATSNPTIGSTISLDAIVITYPVGIQEVKFFGAKHVVYPNPSSTEVNFASNDEKATVVTVYDVTGRKVASGTFENGKAKMELTKFDSGIYIYTIADASKAVLYTSKFNVTK